MCEERAAPPHDQIGVTQAPPPFFFVSGSTPGLASRPQGIIPQVLGPGRAFHTTYLPLEATEVDEFSVCTCAPHRFIFIQRNIYITILSGRASRSVSSACSAEQAPRPTMQGRHPRPRLGCLGSRSLRQFARTGPGKPTHRTLLRITDTSPFPPFQMPKPSLPNIKQRQSSIESPSRASGHRSRC